MMSLSGELVPAFGAADGGDHFHRWASERKAGSIDIMAGVITIAECRSVAERFFATHPYDCCWCRHVLHSQGASVLMDDVNRPRTAVLQDNRSGFCFAAGEEAEIPAIISPLIKLLRSATWPLISVESERWRDRLLAHEAGVFREVPRVALQLNQSHFAPGVDWDEADLAVREIDQAIAGRIAGELDADFGVLWPDPAEFVARSFGYCVMADSRPISYAVSGFDGTRRVCVGIATAQEYRGRGLATRCLAALAERSFSKGMDLEFCTGAGNAPAIAVAKKVGFRGERFHSWVGLRV